MRIIVLCEGRTELAFREALLNFVKRQRNKLPNPPTAIGLGFRQYKGAIPRGSKLKKRVDIYLSERNVLAVVALTDQRGEFYGKSSNEIKSELTSSVNNAKFHPHVAMHDFEAWLLPFWDTIKRRSGVNKRPLASNPESVNDDRPPAHRLENMYQQKRKTYTKPKEAAAILRDNDFDLSKSAQECPELCAFLNTILVLSGLPKLDCTEPLA